MVPAVDSDTDGLSDDRESALGTDLDDPDTDGDGALDGDEMDVGTSPLDPDSDHDGILDGEDPTIEPATRRRGSTSTGNDVEPNDSLDESVSLIVHGSGTLTVEGQIDLAEDVDVFVLGAMAPGDRVAVDFDRIDGGFSPAVAMFDTDGLLFYVAEDLFGPGGPDIGSLVEESFRHQSSPYYFAVAARYGTPTLGSYRFDITIQREGDLVPPLSQAVFLDFDGGSPGVPLLGVPSVSAFDAGAINRTYAGQDDVIKEAIIDTIAENFDPFDIVLYTSDQFTAPPIDDYTTVLFGSFHDSAFGVSLGVDPYNEDPCDDGIVFTEAFTPTVFGFTPTAVELGIAIGNVAAHEAGHLLGLSHVTDVEALMDEASPASFLLADQEFMVAPLSESTFPIGQQDAALLLSETVGDR